MPKLLEKEPSRAKTPGIVSCEIIRDQDTLRIGLHLVLVPKFSPITQISKTLAMLEKKATNSFVQEQEFYLPKNTTISLETVVDRAKFETNKEIIKDIVSSKGWRDKEGYLLGYEIIFERKDNQRGFRVVKFLPNGVKIVLSAIRPKKGLLSRWSPLSAEVSIGISKMVSEEEARELLEAFTHAQY